MQNYYSCLKLRLPQHFGQHLDICPVMNDGNCLYRSLSHIIFGTEMYEQLKTNLTRKIYENPEHMVNVMQMSGITCDQEFTEHLDCIRVRNEWGTNVELAILGALAQVDVLLTNATHVDSHFWRIETVFMGDKLMISTQYNPLYEGQKLGVVLHQLHDSPGLLHFGPFYSV